MKFRMINWITIVATQVYFLACEITVQKSHEICNVDAVILPVLRPLLYEPGSCTAWTFECADVCGFNMKPRNAIQQQVLRQVRIRA